MVEESGHDKELAPIAKHLVSGSTKKAVLAIAGVLTKYFTGSSTAAAVAEETLAKAMAASSEGKLQAEYRELAKEEQERQLTEHLKGLFKEALSGELVELKRFIAGESEQVKEVVETRADGLEQLVDRRADDVIEEVRSLKDARAHGESDAKMGRIVNLPYRSIGTLFKGRDEALEVLRRQLEERDVSAITQVQAIHGLGGVGKTRLAVEYAWRYLAEYTCVCLVRAESKEGLNANLAGLVNPKILNLEKYAEQPESVQVQAVVRWFMDHRGWLVIFDNVDHDDAAEAVEALLPALVSGHVIITSRLGNWGPSFGTQPLDAIDPEEGVRFVLERTDSKREKQAGDEERAARLVETLGRLPLALEQASAYIGQRQCSLADYLKEWEAEKADLLEWADGRLMKYPDSVAVTWKRTYDRLTPQSDPLEALGLLGAGQDTHRDAQGPGRAGAGGLGAPRGGCRADENRRRDRGCDRLLHGRQAGQDPYRAQIGAGGNAVADDRGGAAKLGGKSSGDREKLRAIRPTTS